jgi:hypothetical protein
LYLLFSIHTGWLPEGKWSGFFRAGFEAFLFRELHDFVDDISDAFRAGLRAFFGASPPLKLRFGVHVDPHAWLYSGLRATLSVGFLLGNGKSLGHAATDDYLYPQMQALFSNASIKG